MSSQFKRKIENFTCEKCGFFVEGNGYTNHCPECLWSKHVDKNPGDREEKCGFLMEPVSYEKRGEEFYITHKCFKCGFIRKNSFTKGDNFEALLNIGKGSTIA